MPSAAPPQNLVTVRARRKSVFIRLLRSHLQGVFERLSLAPSVGSAVELAVGEAVANAVRHGRPDTDEKPGWMTLTCRLHAQTLEVDITDDAGGFTPPDAADLPDDFAESGRGLFLMEMLMDSVQFLPVPGGTCVRLRKGLVEKG